LHAYDNIIISFADGNNGAITLRVEMTADAIADIKVVSQSETAGLGDVAIDKMIEAILVAGNTDVGYGLSGDRIQRSSDCGSECGAISRGKG